MKDETYVFISDVKTKGSVARSARKRKTHAGKGGRVRLPSDNLSKKELKKMSGECKSYRLNSPMTWQEFRSMPDDIKITYIKLLREKYNVPDTHLAKMLGISYSPFTKEVARLGIANGKTRSGREHWDKEGFLAWWGGVAVKPEEAQEEAEEFIETVLEEVQEEATVTQEMAIPDSGSMVFQGRTEDILKTIGVLLGGAKVHISITWDVLSEGD
jgi:hypothetical protein